MNREELIAFLEGARWQWAKSYADSSPHAYTARRWHADEVFDAAIAAVRTLGEKRRWNKAYYVYFDHGPFMFWSLSWPPRQAVLNKALRDPDTVVDLEEMERLLTGVV